jgi:uncharacterized protein
MKSVAIGLLCKTPAPGVCKTRLSPPLHPEECSRISACFIRDLSRTIDAVCAETNATPYAVYTPVGTEEALRRLLPQAFSLLPKHEKPFGELLHLAVAELLGLGHTGAILLNSDRPTLPAELLGDAVQAVSHGDAVVLSPALDGGYTLIGLSRPHAHVFAGIPWSTPGVHAATLARAREVGLPVRELRPWYDIDDAEAFALLEAELSGRAPLSAEPGLAGAPAPHTAAFLAERRARIALAETGAA